MSAIFLLPLIDDELLEEIFELTRHEEKFEIALQEFDQAFVDSEPYSLPELFSLQSLFSSS